ncbi:hypothetical protein Scep_030699 [Stephania cephalantha]|uniref:Tafazzin family protein n=1 Tax=Stephania cephalantha TaxID=152367 RepID=A0AAP0E3B0_9MAGN
MAGDWIDRRDVWKDKARSLQLRLRDRFRVAVDRHRRRPRLSDGYVASKVRHFVLRVRCLRGGSLPPASPFYRKRVDGSIDATENSVILRMLQSVAVPVIGNVCHVFMHGLNHIQIFGAEKLHNALSQRPKGKPLITVSNHVASIDDPFVMASLLPPNVMLNSQSLRWTLCATDRCFKNPATSAFFRSVKVLPVSRGDGIYQKGMDLALSKLNSGGWVHIFPEGSRSRDGGKTLGSMKRGVGRLVMDADNMPIVVPFVHAGMQEIMPIGANFPRIGKMVTILVGDPIQFDDLLTLDSDRVTSRGSLYDAISSRIGQRLIELKVQVDRLALEHAIQILEHTACNEERAAGMLQQVDWEAFGMGSYILSKDKSSVQTIEIQPEVDLNQPRGSAFSDLNCSMRFSYEGGIVSRIKGYMEPTELMGFAARGLFMTRKAQREIRNSIQEVAPLQAWKQLLEDGFFRQRNQN